VDPERPGLYRITRYRTLALPTPPESSPEAGNEILLWNAYPAERTPLLCFERVARRRFFTLWLVPHWTWDRIEPGTARYQAEMFRAIQIYGRHRASLGLRSF
jgi:hypothetical protein